MTSSDEQNTNTVPIGELFARAYLERGTPAQDNSFFRNRLEAYLQSNHYADYGKIAAYLQREAGLVVASSYIEKYNNVYYNFSKFFSETRIELVLSAITLIWRFLRVSYPKAQRPKAPGAQFTYTFPQADRWHAFVARAMREENMAYSLDEKCGVHYFVDEEFERNRLSAVAVLASVRYSGARKAFESCHAYLDAQPPDTKAAVRAAFEALEILARLIDPSSKNLNSWMVKNKLKPIAVACASDPVEADTVSKAFEGFASLVDALHNYRHGQGVEQPIAPSMTFSVYVLSTTASLLRWLVELDSSQSIGAAP